jgi:hypothetical protein
VLVSGIWVLVGFMFGRGADCDEPPCRD